MRILIVSPYFPPQLAVASMRVHSFARHWCDAGHDVTVLTTHKRSDQHGLDLPIQNIRVVELDYAVPRVLERLREKHRPQAKPSGDTYRKNAPPASLLMRIKQRTGVFGSVRMPDLTDYWVRPAVAWATSQPAWDVVVSSSGPYTAHLVALEFKRRAIVKRWIADFRDLWTGNHIFSGLFPFTLREKSQERQCLESVDAVTTVSEPLQNWLAQRTKAPVHVIYNGYDTQARKALANERLLPRDGAFRLVFTGSYYPQGQNAMPLFQGIAAMKSDRRENAPQWRIVLAGAACDILMQLAKEAGVEDCVESRGVVAADEALRLQRDADALVLFDWRNAADGVLTGKLFDYLAASPPIFVTGGPVDSPAGQLVMQCGRGWNVQSDISAICERLRLLARSSTATNLVRNERLIQSLSRSEQAQRFLALIESPSQR